MQKGDGEEKKFSPQQRRQTGELTDGEHEEMPFHEVEIVRGGKINKMDRMGCVGSGN